MQNSLFAEAVICVHCLVSVSLGCFEGLNQSFVSASSDGTVAISHYNPENGSWGIMEENQFMFFQR